MKCIKCGKTKSEESFSFKDKANNRRSTVCRSCHSEYMKGHYKKNKAKYLKRGMRNKINRREKMRVWLRELKKNLSCKKCGENDYRVLDFHHKNNKDFSLANAIRRGMSQDRILKEIEKCEVLCCKCHRILHWEDVTGCRGVWFSSPALEAGNSQVQILPS